ncbi:portal_HK97, phage portal protein, HK97 family [uncultured Caudovirales phage]|uniref:Portal_HK97, phage portal protein, HK97 family n=1 Tax=uncultured Caudovirales phage TaxID=2100421 RepID=A0A6J5PHE4_9CAUD|nr:portal_HK97, phage portal protein, HK97 family [uncultured Caudovirales phage]CAB4195350.1 portal_HK97, phage portal protein, HK97 family [uncultured Caudovirales phage]
MGLLSALRLVDKAEPTIKAELAPRIMGDGGFTLNSPFSVGAATRDQAMAVPAVAKARNLICGTISTLGLELYRESDGAKLGKPAWMNQMDPRQPLSVTIAWLLDALIFHGVGYLQIIETYSDTGRPSRMAWVANDRVFFMTNTNSTLITSYYVDGTEVPMEGLGSLITFQGLDTGILDRGAATIRTALALERAALTYAENPLPSGYIQNSGVDLPPDQITGLLQSWKAARNTKSTAYLSSTLKFEAVAFSPKDLNLSESRNYMATEISRLMNVPAYFLDAQSASSMTYSNVSDQNRQLVSYTFRSFLSAIEDRLSMTDITAAGNTVRFDLDDFLRADVLTRIEVYERMIALGLITVDEARAMEDLAPRGNNE